MSTVLWSPGSCSVIELEGEVAFTGVRWPWVNRINGPQLARNGKVMNGSTGSK